MPGWQADEIGASEITQKFHSMKWVLRAKMYPLKTRSLESTKGLQPRKSKSGEYEESVPPKDSKSKVTSSLGIGKTRNLKYGRVSDPRRLGVWKYEEFQSPKDSKSGKYKESLTLRDSKSESTNIFKVR